MSERLPTELTSEFDAAFAALAAARADYEDQPRDPNRIAALGSARVRLEEARSAMDVERQRLGLESPWRVQPADVETTAPPPLWSVRYAGGS